MKHAPDCDRAIKMMERILVVRTLLADGARGEVA